MESKESFNNKIKTAKEDREILQLISNICIDYDGYDNKEELKSLIDEIKDISDKQLRRGANNQW